MSRSKDDTMDPKAQDRNIGYFLRLKLFLNFSQICLLSSRLTEIFLIRSLSQLSQSIFCIASNNFTLQSFKSLYILQPLFFLIHKPDHINFLLKALYKFPFEEFGLYPNTVYKALKNQVLLTSSN